MPTFPDQQVNEKDMAERGKNRTNKRLNSHIEREEESVTSYGKVMVANTIRPLAMHIGDWIKRTSERTICKPPIAFTKLCEVEPEILALITGKHIINTITQYKPLTATCISLGGKVETEIALKNFKKLECTNIDTIVGEFEETFSKKLTEKSNVNMVFVDGNHSEDATIRYFEESIKYSDQKTILIFDDIHWSSGMEKAWDYIKKSQKTRVTVDLFFVGLVFLDQKLSKENFIIRF